MSERSEQRVDNEVFGLDNDVSDEEEGVGVKIEKVEAQEHASTSQEIVRDVYIAECLVFVNIQLAHEEGVDTFRNKMADL